MKRRGFLWERLISFENLLAAAEKACKGKRFRAPVAAFHYDLERQLWRLHRELEDKSYRPAPTVLFSSTSQSLARSAPRLTATGSSTTP